MNTFLSHGGDVSCYRIVIVDRLAWKRIHYDVQWQVWLENDLGSKNMPLTALSAS